MSAIPNSFQTPNEVVDRLMFLLNESELKVLLFAIRHILGWHDRVDSRRGQIAVSVFANGYIDGNGKAYAGTGLSPSTIRNVLKSFEEWGIVERKDIQGKASEWTLAFMNGKDIDYSKLQERQEKKQNRQKKQTKNWQKAAADKRLQGDEPLQLNNGGQFDYTPIVEPEEYPYSSTGGVPLQLNNTHTNTVKSIETQEKDYPAPESKPQRKLSAQQLAVGALMEAFEVKTLTGHDKSNMGKVAKELLTAGLEPGEIEAFVAFVRRLSKSETNWTVTPNSLTTGLRVSRYMDWRDKQRAVPQIVDRAPINPDSLPSASDGVLTFDLKPTGTEG